MANKETSVSGSNVIQFKPRKKYPKHLSVGKSGVKALYPVAVMSRTPTFCSLAPNLSYLLIPFSFGVNDNEHPELTNKKVDDFVDEGSIEFLNYLFEKFFTKENID